MEKIKASFLSPLKELSQLLSKTHTKSVIIGGISASLLGKPRFTADIDAVLLLNFDKIDEFILSAVKFGFAPRITDAAAFARKSHVILLTHKKSGIDVDLSIGLLPFELETLERSTRYKAQNVTFNIPTPEDLIIMKSVSHRPRDMEDIDAIIDSHAKLDIKRIKYWVKEFARILEMPEIYGDLEKLIRRKKR